MAIYGKVIENGTLRLILTADTEIGKAALKQLNGATCTTITENVRIFDENVSEGLVIELKQERG